MYIFHNQKNLRVITMYSILFEKKFQRKSKNRLLRHESATRFWVQKLRQNQTGALLNGCTVSGAKFRGELESGKKLDVYATKRAGLEANFWSILNKKNAPNFGAFFTFISRILYECLACSASRFLRRVRHFQSRFSPEFWRVAQLSFATLFPFCSLRFSQQSSAALTPQIKRTL